MKKRYERPSMEVVRFVDDRDSVLTTSGAGYPTPVPTTAAPTSPEDLNVPE